MYSFIGQCFREEICVENIDILEHGTHVAGVKQDGEWGDTWSSVDTELWLDKRYGTTAVLNTIPQSLEKWGLWRPSEKCKTTEKYDRFVFARNE